MTRQYQLYACLPFVELTASTAIQMGPVIFWSSDQAVVYTDPDLVTVTADYFNAIKAEKISNNFTCISIDTTVSNELKNSLLLDSIYLYFFCGAFSTLYQLRKAPSLDAFTRLLPASPDFLANRDQWEQLHIPEAQREPVEKLTSFDPQMCRGLGHALACAYGTETCKSATESYKLQGLIRAIRYFVDRFVERFKNLVGTGLSISNLLYEAEDIVFLATSYEALFDLNETQPHIDLKHRLRPMLGLRYSAPVELLWLWVDGFFRLREQIVHGRSSTRQVFHGNPNYEISYYYLGMKLFLYGVYWRLYTYDLVDHPEGSSEPYAFPGVKPEELLVYFWPEEALLNRMVKIMHSLDKEWEHLDLRNDLTLLGQIYMHMHETNKSGPGAKWKPTPAKRLREASQPLLALIEANSPSLKLLPANFAQTITQSKR